jgi:general secretion pathway protein E
MPKTLKQGLSEDLVLQVLSKYRLISEAQKKEIFNKKRNIKRKLEKLRAFRQASASSRGRIVNPITMVDVITAMELRRKDDSSKVLDEETIFQALAQAWGIPYKKVDPLQLDLNLVTTTIPHSFAMKHLVLPIAVHDGYLTVATPDPFNEEVMRDVAQASQMRVRSVVSTKTDIIKLINEFFGFKRSIVAAENQFGVPTVDLGNLEQFVRLRADDELPSTDQHIVNAVDHLLSYAFDQRASDVHIEPKREKSIVRLRIDGILHTIYELPKNVHSAIISRVKTISRLDMAEKRRPQDGRIKMEKGGVEAEIRVSSIPVAFGEKLVMRIMDPDVNHGPAPLPAVHQHAPRHYSGLRSHRERQIHHPLFHAP